MDPQLVKRIYTVFAQAYDDPAFMEYLKMNAIDPVLKDGTEFRASYDVIASYIHLNLNALTGTR